MFGSEGGRELDEQVRIEIAFTMGGDYLQNLWGLRWMLGQMPTIACLQGWVKVVLVSR